ncbi:unnamed protein product [Phyllotreta striolata]|uniref:Notch ligand N-terminal domain-containing protein n=1 Tax=Phyllotreta striolata TaxID=444603 RepID=A0A9N9TZI6_PHYSR|nr:unnamed protein product [Phyllotreta striolata]
MALRPTGFFKGYYNKGERGAFGSCWCTHGSGVFELQVLEMSNPRGELSNGECCGGGGRSPVTNRCSVSCQTFFMLCLKEYQSNVTNNGLCSFGNTSSHVIGRDSFTLADPDRGKLELPFTFRWTRSNFLVEKKKNKNKKNNKKKKKMKKLGRCPSSAFVPW